MASPATDVFLSYKAEDQVRVAPLVEALEAEGFTVWWDAHIGGGTNWQEEIEKHLDAAKCVVVAWSQRSVGHDGHFVRDEARRAQRRGAYVPVCLDGVEPPLGFGEIQAIPLTGWKGDRADAQFQAVADAVRGRITGEHISHPHVRVHTPRVSRRAVVAGGAGVAAVAAAGGWFLLRPHAPNAKRIAVMPFANLSGAEDRTYFAEGIAEELRSALSRIGLQVIGRASSDAVKDLDTKSAASRLGVANILTGSVRRSPQMIRVSAQLVSGTNGVQRWAQTYDRAPGDAIKIQTDIAINVAQALSLALGQAGKAALALGGTADAVAQGLLMRSREIYFSTSDENSAHEAIGLLDAAIARDPNYAQAYATKARILIFLAGTAHSPAEMADLYAQAKAIAMRARALAPRLGSAYVALAAIEGYRLNIPSALQYMRRALALSPEDSDVLSWATYYMMNFGDGHKALEFADRLVALDPLNANSHTDRAAVFRHALRAYPQSIAAYRRALNLSPKRFDVHVSIGHCLLLMNRPLEARAEYQKAPADNDRRMLGEALLAARSHDAAETERIMSRMRAMSGEAASWHFARINAQAGDADRAFAELDNAVRIKDPGVLGIKTDPFLDPIRRDPRYSALLKRLNFPTWT